MTHGRGFFVLHEVRLSAGDPATRLRAAARLADMPHADDERVLPMLVSIDDHRDVACVRRVGALPGSGDEAGARVRRALTPGAEGGAPPRYYDERAAVAGEGGARSYYRMAVTESGINEEAAASTLADAPAPAGAPAPPRQDDATGAALLWIGTPVASAPGLLVITGHHDATGYEDSEPGVWPLPTSRRLGVRIYEGGTPKQLA